MKRFLRNSTQDYPHGFGQVVAPPEEALTNVSAVKADFRKYAQAVANHGAVLYERPESEDEVPALECKKWINDTLRGVLFHDGIIGHSSVHDMSLFALAPSTTATLCANVNDVAQATRTVFQDRSNRDVFQQQGLLARTYNRHIQTVVQDICSTLKKADQTKQRVALSKARSLLMTLSLPTQGSVSAERIYGLARDIQLQVGDALMPIDWNQYWLAHMSDDVMHARDIRTKIQREHNQTFGYCSQTE